MSIPLEHKPANGTVVAQSGGALDELRAVYEAVDTGEDQTEVFPVPSTNIAVRYRRLGIEKTRQILNIDGLEWQRHAQFLIDACDEILYRNPETGELGPVLEGVRVTFDFRPEDGTTPLHQVLGHESTDIRESVLRLFKGADRVLVLHARDVDAWMDSLHAKQSEAFSGG
jgi:hypothetical protein